MNGILAWLFGESPPPPPIPLAPQNCPHRFPKWERTYSGSNYLERACIDCGDVVRKHVDLDLPEKEAKTIGLPTGASYAERKS